MMKEYTTSITKSAYCTLLGLSTFAHLGYCNAHWKCKAKWHFDDILTVCQTRVGYSRPFSGSILHNKVKHLFPVGWFISYLVITRIHFHYNDVEHKNNVFTVMHLLILWGDKNVFNIIMMQTQKTWQCMS